MRAITWMALLCLAALQSPFAPGYVVIALLWAVTLLSVEVRSVVGAAALALLWILCTAVLPLPFEARVMESLLQTAVVLCVPIWLILRRHPPEPG